MGRTTGSWLSGPSAALPQGQIKEGKYPGDLLGLPAAGVNSLAPTPRRMLALFLDWIMAGGVASLFIHGQLMNPLLSTMVLLIWFIVGVTSVSLFGFTPAQYLLGMQVIRVDAAARVTFWQALLRNLLLMFVLPALIGDSDGRGMHDRVTRTALVRAR